MTSLRVVDFSFAYEADQPSILNKINLDLTPGSFNLMVGPSGSGKSTLLKALAGLLPKFGGIVTNGDVLLEGQSIGPIAPFEKAKRVAMLFQNPDRQFAMRIAREQITFALENLQLPVGDIERRVTDAIARLNLDALADQELLTLSGGEKQRVALATIFAMQSDIILLDEPFANVDPAARQLLLQDLKDLQQTNGTTILISDHDLSGYANLVDTLYQLDTQTGTLHEASRHMLTDIAPAPTFGGTPVGDGPLRWQYFGVAVGDRQLLHDATFTAPAGQIGLISGANGIGKSTFFKGLTHQRAYDGQILWENVDGRKVKQKHWSQRLALVFQSAIDQFVTMTVASEIALSKKFSLQANYWTDDRVAAALEKLQLSDLQDHVVYQLSGGQQKKLQLLTMLIMGQPVLLLDEPLAGLDSASVNVLMTLLQETIQQTNQTVLMISHQRQGLTGFVDYELHFADQQLTLIGGTQHV
ncbi:ATP-binding cassette domain-containing protein [Weissella confusa]|uniref:ATP-binding cassette domain-containing protein n=1 Tax=Weissella confusa TaxID=1583 RepID=UPI0022E6D163|nr:ABC transporter ATP-binding protein [Weissella confusa]